MNTSYRFALDKIGAAYVQEIKNKAGHKYIALYRGIKRCILDIDLPHNWLLPSTRILASEFGLSRTTVNKSYELLQLERLIVAKAGSGFRIHYNNKSKTKGSAQNINKAIYPSISEKGKSFTNNIGIVNRDLNDNLAFRPGLPPIDAFPVNQWKKLLNTHWRHIKSSNLSYSSSTGLIELKKSVSNYLNISRNIKCNPDHIVIVSGSLQSLYLIATALIDKNDAVVVENPVFPNVHSVFKSSEAQLIPARVNDRGIDIKGLDLGNLRPKLIHVTPSNQYPLGIKMSLKRRQELLKWASRHKALIIENDYENEIANHSKQIPSIYSLDQEDRTIYIGTFNRLLHPSLRLGFMVVPKYLIKTVEALQEHSHRFVSPSIQVVMTQFIEKNYLYRHLKFSIEIAKERYALFCKEFNTISSKLYITPKPCESFHVVAKFVKPAKLEEELSIIEALQALNISAHALSKCYIGKAGQRGVIFGYAAVRPAVLIKKIQKMRGIV